MFTNRLIGKQEVPSHLTSLSIWGPNIRAFVEALHVLTGLSQPFHFLRHRCS